MFHLITFHHKVTNFYNVIIVSRDLVDVLHNRGVPVFLVSGGFRCLITPVAEQLGIPLDMVFANRLKFYVTGELISFKSTHSFDSHSFHIQFIIRLLQKNQVYLISQFKCTYSLCRAMFSHFISFAFSVP